jgi:hypothetical protein
MDNTFLQARIDAAKAQITAAEDLLLVLMLEDTPTNRSYTLNTGQSVVTVTKRDADNLSALIDSLYNRLATLEARLNGTGGQVVCAF